MNITKQKQDGILVVVPEGRLDTNTSRELEEVLNPELADISSLTIDFSQIQYVSSAGLRVLLSVQKKMKDRQFVLTNVNKNILEVFEITGFVDFLTIE